MDLQKFNQTKKQNKMMFFNTIAGFLLLFLLAKADERFPHNPFVHWCFYIVLILLIINFFFYQFFNR